MVDVAELRRLEAEATSGEWYVEETDDWWELYAENAHPEWGSIINPRGLAHPLKIAKCAKRNQAFAEYWPNDADSALIVALRNAAPALLDEVERLRSIVEKASRMQYRDSDGNECSLDVLVRSEPEWAANQLRHLRARVAGLEGALQELLNHTPEALLYEQDGSKRRAAKQRARVILSEAAPSSPSASPEAAKGSEGS